MAISYQKINQIQESWGIDVVVRFTDVDINITKIFKFDNQKQIDLEFAERMVKAITNIENKIAADKKPTLEGVLNRLEKHFGSYSSLSKVEYESIKNAELIRAV